MNNIGYIYKITNSINGKIYIGKTKYTIEKRWKQHLKAVKDYKDTKIQRSKLYRAMNKYGVENFYIEQIESCNYSILSEREIYWISELNSRDSNIGYNICKGGSSGPGGPMFKGHKHTEETKKQMSDNRKGKMNSNYGNHWHHTKEMKYKYNGINNPMFGKKHSIETKQLISKQNTGKICMTNGKQDIRILEEQVQYYENLGYWKGRTFAHGRKSMEGSTTIESIT